MLIAAGVLYAAEFVADKIPYVDSLWDAVHTVIRPATGATLGVLLSGDADSLQQAFLAGTGAIIALVLLLAGAALVVTLAARIRRLLRTRPWRRPLSSQSR